MTFLSLLLRDTGTNFRIPQRMTFLWFTRARVRTQLEISQPVDCRGFRKADITPRTAVELLTKAVLMLASLLLKIVFHQLVTEWQYFRLFYEQGRELKRGYLKNTQTSLIGKIHLFEWKTASFKTRF